jgi:hypothetical protein
MDQLLEKEVVGCFFPKELTAHFEIVNIKLLCNVEAKEEFFLIEFEEKNSLPEHLDKSEYESKGFFEKTIQDFSIRGKAVFLRIKRRRWRHKVTKESVSKDFSFIADGSKFTQELSDFLKERGGDQA